MIAVKPQVEYSVKATVKTQSDVIVVLLFRQTVYRNGLDVKGEQNKTNKTLTHCQFQLIYQMC